MTELVIIVVLIVVNGVFAMSEAAVIASRRARLQQLAEKGNRRAQAALRLSENPNRFLSTVQIGITLIGIMAGVFGGATVAEPLANELRKIEALAPYASGLSYGLVILFTTYLSLVIGELVPKRLALRDPERIASTVAGPMGILSRVASPAVTILSKSTDGMLWLMRIRQLHDPVVTAEEITTMVQQGVDAGIFTEGEHEIVEGIFDLTSQRVRGLMTPRTEVMWLDIQDTDEENQQKILDSTHSRFVVGDGSLDNVLGVANTRDMFVRALRNEPFDLRAGMTEALFVPETMHAVRVLEQFKASGRQLAVVLGEHGGVEGIVTLQDLLNEIVSGIEPDDTIEVVEREDGSWLLDGMMPVDEFKALLEVDDLPGERELYETLGGFMMARLERVPAAADRFEWDQYAFEVMDMDGHRVDKVLVSRVVTPEPATPAEAEENKI